MLYREGGSLDYWLCWVNYSLTHCSIGVPSATGRPTLNEGDNMFVQHAKGNVRRNGLSASMHVLCANIRLRLALQLNLCYTNIPTWLDFPLFSCTKNLLLASRIVNVHLEHTTFFAVITSVVSFVIMFQYYSSMFVLLWIISISCKWNRRNYAAVPKYQH